MKQGKNGNVIDARLDKDGRVVVFVIDSNKSKFFRFSKKYSEKEVRWGKIDKIGAEVILIQN